MRPPCGIVYKLNFYFPRQYGCQLVDQNQIDFDLFNHNKFLITLDKWFIRLMQRLKMKTSSLKQKIGSPNLNFIRGLFVLLGQKMTHLKTDFYC